MKNHNKFVQSFKVERRQISGTHFVRSDAGVVVSTVTTLYYQFRGSI